MSQSAMGSAWDQSQARHESHVSLRQFCRTVSSSLTHLLVAWCAELSNGDCVKDAADPVFFCSIRGTPRRLESDDEPREPREPREQPLRIDVRPVRADLPPISTGPSPEIQLSWLDTG